MINIEKQLLEKINTYELGHLLLRGSGEYKIEILSEKIKGHEDSVFIYVASLHDDSKRFELKLNRAEFNSQIKEYLEKEK